MSTFLQKCVKNFCSSIVILLAWTSERSLVTYIMPALFLCRHGNCTLLHILVTILKGLKTSVWHFLDYWHNIVITGLLYHWTCVTRKVSLEWNFSLGMLHLHGKMKRDNVDKIKTIKNFKIILSENVVVRYMKSSVNETSFARVHLAKQYERKLSLAPQNESW